MKKIISLFALLITFSTFAQVTGTPVIWKKAACPCADYSCYSDADGDGVPDCNDQCPGGDDAIDTNGNGIPDCAEGCSVINDKSNVSDTDGDGIKDACDLDSDNDGIQDSLEDANKNGLFEDDDVDGNVIVTSLGDGIPNYRDLDSDNDGIMDLHESGIPISVINIIDKDRNGVIDLDAGNFGENGILDILETYPDSGIMKYPLADTNGDGIPDFLDIMSNGVTYDLYAIGKANLDYYFGGIVQRTSDHDGDGIMNPVDTDLGVRGAPGSPLSPYSKVEVTATTFNIPCANTTNLNNLLVPVTTYNLTLQWHTVLNPTSTATLVPNATQVGAGTYYAIYVVITPSKTYYGVSTMVTITCN